MKIFISWSGDRSRAVAEALNDWLQRVIQAVEPFYTPVMEKGVKWSNEIDTALEGTRFGIVCLTPDNLKSTWIHYETGALSKTKDAVIWTFLHGLVPSDVPQPLGRFQHTLAEKGDVFKLLQSINSRLREIGGNALKDALLEEIFEESWAKLESKLKDAEKLSVVEIEDNSEPIRPQKDVLDEILEVVRNQNRQIHGIENRLEILARTTIKTIEYDLINENFGEKETPRRAKGIKLFSYEGASFVVKNPSKESVEKFKSTMSKLDIST